MTVSPGKGVEALGRQYPEWKPWLPVVEEVLNEAADSKWDRFIPSTPEPQPDIPLLARATLIVDLAFVRQWISRLMRTARQSGTGKMATLGRADSTDTPGLFKASLCQDSERLKQLALSIEADPDAFRAVADLVPVPFLHACAKRWSRPGNAWMQGYCFLCGAWAAFAEVRGIERSRHLRCGRCESDWEARWLYCIYCGMTDHEQLVSLVPETGTPTRTIEACKRCLGYLKSFMTLQGSPAGKVMVDDLASVDLDLVALEQQYKRPVGLGYALEVAIVERS
jgi:FdhE protein